MNRYADEKTYLEFNDGIKIQFFDIYGKKESELNAGTAIIDDKNDLYNNEKDILKYIE